jgi:hypothetical protein
MIINCTPSWQKKRKRKRAHKDRSIELQPSELSSFQMDNLDNQCIITEYLV